MGVPVSAAALQPRWDRINSAEAIGRARRIYYAFLERCSGSSEPLGIVMAGEAGAGRVVFELPVLLPAEQFIPLELVRGRPGRSRAARPVARS
jgi:hypothetical protein